MPTQCRSNSLLETRVDGKQEEAKKTGVFALPLEEGLNEIRASSANINAM